MNIAYFQLNLRHIRRHGYFEGLQIEDCVRPWSVMPDMVVAPRKRNHSPEKKLSSPQPLVNHAHLFNAKPAKIPKFVEKTPSPEANVREKSIGQAREVDSAGWAQCLPDDLQEDSIGLPDIFLRENPFNSQKKRLQNNPMQCIQSEKAKESSKTDIIESIEDECFHELVNAHSVVPDPDITWDPHEITPPTKQETADPTHLKLVKPSSPYFYPDRHMGLFSAEVEEGDFESIKASKDQLVQYISTKMKLTAMTLKDLLSALSLLTSLEQLRSAPIKILELELFICAGKKDLFSKPKRPLQLPSVLKAETDSHEQFLSKIWQLLRSKPAMTSFNSELHSGIWYRLISLIGREWVAFILLNFRIYRPSRYEQHCWLQLAGPYTLLDSELQFAPRRLFFKNNSCMTKADIMYRSSKGAAFSQSFNPKDNSHFHPELPPLLSKVAKRISQYLTLDRLGKIKVPSSASEARKWVPQKAVARFVRHRLDKLLPISILGSKNNKAAFHYSVSSWIKLSGFKRTSIKQMSKGIKLSEVPWLRNTEDRRTAKLHLEKCIEWIIQSLLKPLILHHFYLTEISGRPGSLYYFNQEVWIKSFLRPASKDLLKRLNESSDFKRDQSRTESNINCLPSNVNAKSQAVERWRVTPKADGTTRIIINLKTFNETLRDTHLILRHATAASDTRLDSWHDWMIRLYSYRDKVTESGQRKQTFYLVKLDLSNCYDNAKVEKVKEIAARALNSGRDVYRVQNLKRLCLNTGKLSHRRVAFKLPEANQHDARTFAKSQRSNNGTAIIIETGIPSLVQGDSALFDIDRIFNDINIRIFSSSLHYSSGIPQGSACSLDLCNLMLDDLVSSKLGKFAEDPESLLLRYVDDFLFVSTSEKLVLEFQQSMLNNFELEYGLICKPSKSSSNCWSQTSKVRRMSFLGHDIDTKTLDVFPKKVPRHIQVPTTSSTDTIRKMLSFELESLLGVARAFKRANIPLPARLLQETARRFGAALAGGRLERFRELQKSTIALSEFQVRQKVTHRYLLNLVDKKMWGQTRRMVMQSFNRKAKLLQKCGKSL